MLSKFFLNLSCANRPWSQGLCGETATKTLVKCNFKNRMRSGTQPYAADYKLRSHLRFLAIPSIIIVIIHIGLQHQGSL